MDAPTSQSSVPPVQQHAPVVISAPMPTVQDHRPIKRKALVRVIVVRLLVLTLAGTLVWWFVQREKTADISQLDILSEPIPLTPEMEQDRDLDGVPNSVEDELGTSNEEFDTDGDGLSDKMEIELGTDPTNIDTDGDGYLDGMEILRGYNPNGPGNLPAN